MDEATRARIDLLLIDIVMPQIRGPELARRIMATRPGLRLAIDSRRPHTSSAASLGVAKRQLESAGPSCGGSDLRKPMSVEVACVEERSHQPQRRGGRRQRQRRYLCAGLEPGKHDCRRPGGRRARVQSGLGHRPASCSNLGRRPTVPFPPGNDPTLSTRAAAESRSRGCCQRQVRQFVGEIREAAPHEVRGERSFCQHRSCREARRPPGLSPRPPHAAPARSGRPPQGPPR